MRWDYDVGFWILRIFGEMFLLYVCKNNWKMIVDVEETVGCWVFGNYSR